MTRKTYNVIVLDPYRGANVPRLYQSVTAPDTDPIATIMDAAAPSSVAFIFTGLGNCGLLGLAKDQRMPALELSHHIGFTPQALFSWERLDGGIPYPVIDERGTVFTTEGILMCTRGAPSLKAIGVPPFAGSIFRWEKGIHPHQKPAAFYEWLMTVLPGPYAACWLPDAPAAFDKLL